MSGVFTGPTLEHLLVEHIHVISRPPNNMRMILVAESCTQNLAPPQVFILINEIQSYITSLPVASAEEAGDTCNICYEKFGDSGSTDPETPLRLPCGHVFGSDCLTKLLLADNDTVYTNSACPLCRRRMEIFDFGDATVW